MTQQMALPLRVNDGARFDNYYLGPNAAVVKALDQMFKDTVDLPLNPVLLFGYAGTGKSHLLYAIANHLSRFDQTPQPGLRSSYLALSDASISSDMLEDLEADQIILLDDVHVWAGDIAREQALFGLYERVKQAQGMWVASSHASADKSGFILPDLVSRLSSGLQFQLRALSEIERMEALKLRAEYRGFNLADEPVRYLVKHFSRDMHSLFQLLETMDAKTLEAGRKITVPFLKEILSQ